MLFFIFQALIKLRGSDSFDAILTELAEYELEKSAAGNTSIKWSDLWTRIELRRLCIVALVINMSQQFSGINAISFYSAIIFEQAGLEGEWPVRCTVLVSFAQFVMTFFCMGFIDRLGRKTLLLISLSGMGISCCGLAIFDIISKEVLYFSEFL